MSEDRLPGWYWTKYPGSDWVPERWDGEEWEDASMDQSYFHGQTMIVGPKIEEPEDGGQ